MIAAVTERAGRHSVWRAGVDFVLDGKRTPGHPAVVDLDGRVVLPVADYLHRRAVRENVAGGTLLDEAYVLAAWLDFLAANGRDWSDASDRLITAHARDLEARGRGLARVQRCVGVVFRFYWEAQNRLGLVDGLVEDPQDGRTRRRPISVVPSKSGVPQPCHRYVTIPEGPGRPTPDEPQVERILDHLLDRVDGERATCFWLAASLMCRAGLRREGVAGVTLTALARALLEAGIGDGRRPHDLQAAARNGTARSSILDGLSRLVSTGRTKVFLSVTEKGRRTRLAGVPVELVEHMLAYAWSERALLVSRLATRSRGYRPPDALFLSLKTGRGLRETSIGNLVNGAFAALGIGGSAHRLRAAFAEGVVRDAYLRARAIHGGAWDEDAVLLEAAEALGHRSTRNLKPYLHRIMREIELVEGTPVVVTAASDVDLVRSMVDVINGGDSTLAARLRKILEEYGDGGEGSRSGRQPGSGAAYAMRAARW